MNFSAYEIIYKTTKLSGDKENAIGLICAHSHEEALYIAEDLVKCIKEAMNEKEEDDDI